jgi:endonuclease VIII
MPEGDTIFRTAVTLDRALRGKTVKAFRSPLPALADARLEGLRVERVEALGKNLVVRFEDGRALRTHLRMHGAWHIYRPGERWFRSPRGARAVIETDDFVAVCFMAPVVELLRPGGIERHPVLAGLGPDLARESFDRDEALRRLRERGEMAIADALLDQRAVAGIGNVYKSEALFEAGVSPFARVGDLDDETLARVLDAARAQLRANLGGFPRRTRRSLDAVRLWVYRRKGKPCLRCGAAIRMRRQGSGRSTYWCPRCQCSGVDRFGS